jgi:hypothetical protein
MPDPINTDRLTAVRDLLREGRTTEADRALDALQEEIRQEVERRKRDLPPPAPQTLEELTDAFMVEVCARLGNPPRLSALLYEIEGKQKEPG